MPGVLTRQPLRTTRQHGAPDLSDVDPAAFPATDPADLPLGYAFDSSDPAAMVTGLRPATAEPVGAYDPETQTWRWPDGMDITMLKSTCLTYVPNTGKDRKSDDFASDEA